MKKIYWLALVSWFLLVGCGNQQKEGQREMQKQKTVLTVSILPQRYFVERIAGDNFKINVMIPPGHSPATYEPTPRDMQAVSESKLYLRIGHIAFEEAWMDKLKTMGSDMKIIDTSKGVELITGMEPHSHGGHAASDEEHHGHLHHHDHHHHGGVDPHIWLSPSAVKIVAGHILKGIIELDPGNREVYEKNHREFTADIDRLHEENKKLLAPLQGKKFMVYHPAWSYFAREYGLVQFPIEFEGKSPGTAGMKKVIDIALKENIKMIFVQSQFDTSSAAAVAGEIGGKVVSLDPLALDWLENMKKITATFKETL